MNNPPQVSFPKSYEAYLQLCEKRGFPPALDASAFENIAPIIDRDCNSLAGALDTVVKMPEELLMPSIGASVQTTELVQGVRTQTSFRDLSNDELCREDWSILLLIPQRQISN